MSASLARCTGARRTLRSVLALRAPANAMGAIFLSDCMVGRGKGTKKGNRALRFARTLAIGWRALAKGRVSRACTSLRMSHTHSAFVLSLDESLPLARAEREQPGEHQ